MRTALPVLVAAAALAACTSLSDHPEFAGLTDIAIPASNAAPEIKAELVRVQALGNTYLEQGQSLETEAKYAGAGTLGFGLYGAAVAAFNPAKNNLLAALIGAATFQSWRTTLKPGERAKVYVQGYRALDCLQNVGGVLQVNAGKSSAAAESLRQEISGDRTRLDEARRAADTAPNKADLLARLAAVETSLTDLDTALRTEQDALIDAPYRIASVRRSIENAVDRRVDGLAPDYAAALKLIGDAAKPPSGGGGTDTKAPAAPAPDAHALVALPTPEQQVAALEASVVSIKSRAPTVATDAYANMGHCIEVAG